jgi:hypothetical protein
MAVIFIPISIYPYFLIPIHIYREQSATLERRKIQDGRLARRREANLPVVLAALFHMTIQSDEYLRINKKSRTC